MQNQNIQKFASQSALLVPDGQNRRILVPAVIGLAIANFLQPKLGDDLNPMTAYNDVHRGNVERAISALNEDMIIDVVAAIEAAKAMYIVRHRIINCIPGAYSASPEFDFLAVVLGLSTVMPVQVYDVIRACGLSSSKLYCAAVCLIEDLKKTNFITSL